MIGDDGLRLWAWQDHKLTLRCSRESDLLQCLHSGKHKETMYYVRKLMHKKSLGYFWKEMVKIVVKKTKLVKFKSFWLRVKNF
jgi:hypothetical protein